MLDPVIQAIINRKLRTEGKLEEPVIEEPKVLKPIKPESEDKVYNPLEGMSNLDKVKHILLEYNQRESEIPLDHPYWKYRNRMQSEL